MSSKTRIHYSSATKSLETLENQQFNKIQELEKEIERRDSLEKQWREEYEARHKKFCIEIGEIRSLDKIRI